MRSPVGYERNMILGTSLQSLYRVSQITVKTHAVDNVGIREQDLNLILLKQKGLHLW